MFTKRLTLLSGFRYTKKMKNKFLLASAIIVVCGTALLIAWTHKTIAVNIDGQVSWYQTWSWTVGSALAGAGIPLGPSDQLQPSQDTILKNGQAIEIRRARPISVQADGKVVSLLTVDRLPKAWLNQAGFSLAPGDLLFAAGVAIDPQETTIAQAVQVRRQQTLLLDQDGVNTTLKSSALTIGDVLWEAGIRLHSSDVISPPVLTDSREGMVITLQTARLLHVKVNGMELALNSTANTVGAALAEAGLALQGLDYTIPSEAAAIPPDGNIRLVRVREDFVVHETPLPFKTTYQPVDDLEIDNQKIVQAGLSGIEATRERVRYEDGIETSRQMETQWVARMPQDRVIGYGTLAVRHTLNTPDGTITYWRALKMWATSYHPSGVGGDTTASGLKVRKGLVAIDLRIIPFFTQMYIPGYGKATAADTGGGIQGRMIDLAYPDDGYVPWHQYVTVYFLWPPPANIVYQIP